MKYATGEGLAGQADEILVEAQAGGAALLWVKLGGYEVSAGVDTAEWDSVLGRASYSFEVLRCGVIAVDEVEITVLRDSSDQRVWVLEVDVVPAHVWDLQVFGKLSC